MIIPYIFSIISLILGILSGIFPYCFLGNFIFLNTFLLMNEHKIDFFLFKISSYRIFVLSFLFIILIRLIRSKKFNLKDSLLSCNSRSFFIFSTYLLIPPALTIIHYLIWGVWPEIFIYQYIKSSWPLLLVLLPFNNPDYFDLKKIFHYLSMVILVILLILTPSSLCSWFDSKIAFFRLRTSWENWERYTGLYYIDGLSYPILSLSETASLIWIVFSTSLIFFLGGLLGEKKVKKIFTWIAFVFIGFILYVNKSGKMIFMFLIQIGTLFFLKLNYQRKIQTIVMGIALILISIGLLFFNEELHNKFVKEEINIGKPINDYERRIPVLKYTLAKTMYVSPWKGFGFPKNFDRNTILPSGDASVAQSTGHSEGIDQMFYFGIPLGFLSSILFWLPLLVLLCSYKRLWRSARNTYSLLTLTSFLSFVCRFIGELGRDVYANVIFVYFFVLILIFHHKGEEV